MIFIISLFESINNNYMFLLLQIIKYFFNYKEICICKQNQSTSVNEWLEGWKWNMIWHWNISGYTSCLEMPLSFHVSRHFRRRVQGSGASTFNLKRFRCGTYGANRQKSKCALFAAEGRKPDGILLKSVVCETDDGSERDNTW